MRERFATLPNSKIQLFYGLHRNYVIYQNVADLLEFLYIKTTNKGSITRYKMILTLLVLFIYQN